MSSPEMAEGAVVGSRAHAFKPHWYFIYQSFCVLCGKSEETRERRYTPRPERAEDRYDYQEGSCGDHFC